MTNAQKPLTTAQAAALDKTYENGRWIGSGSIHHATAGALQRLGLLRVQESFPSGGCRFILTPKGHKVAAERALATKRAERLQAQREDADKRLRARFDAGDGAPVPPARTEVHTFDAANPEPFDETREVARGMIGLGIEGVWVKGCGAHANCTVSVPVPKGVTPDQHRDAVTSLAQAIIRTVGNRLANEVTQGAVDGRNNAQVLRDAYYTRQGSVTRASK
jgi:hypothetical protein